MGGDFVDTGTYGAVAGEVRPTCFDLLHPAVALAYWAAALVLAMCAMEPVYLALTLAGQLAWRACARGARGAARGLLWQGGVVLVLAVANPIFVASGSTELLRVGSRAVYLEAVAYGACQGLLLVNALACFANAADVLTSDKVMGLLGNAVPTVALMCSMTCRLVPQFVARGREVGATSRACTCAAAPTSVGGSLGTGPDDPKNGSSGPVPNDPRRGRLREGMRLSTVLLGWGLEDSLATADAMRARGWGAGARRSTYRRQRFRGTDAAALAVVLALAASSAAAAWVACASWSFYPTLGGLSPWPSYLPYALLQALPTAAELAGRRAWA